MENNKIYSPYEYAGGVDKFEKLTEVFYVKVLKNEILESISRRHLILSPHVGNYIIKK